MNSIACADCGQSHETKRKNTKYCRVCRLNRDLQFFSQRTSTCMSCDAKYAPYKANQVVCAECLFEPASAPVSTCGLCKQQRKILNADVNVCFHCALDPAERGRFMKAVRAKVVRRTAEAVAA